MNEWQKSARFLATLLMRHVREDDPIAAAKVAREILERVELELDVCGTCGETYIVSEGECCAEESPEELRARLEEDRDDAARQSSASPFGLPFLPRRF